MGITSFFANTLGAPLANSRWSWGAQNPNKHHLYLRTWTNEIIWMQGNQYVLLLMDNDQQRSNGLPERRIHIELLQNGVPGSCVMLSRTPRGRIANFVQLDVFSIQELVQLNGGLYAQIGQPVHMG